MSLVLTLLLTLAAPQDGVDRSVDAILRARGIDNLTPDQQVRIRGLVLDLVRQGAASSDASRSAERYLEREGYRKCELSIVRVDGTDWMVHSSAYGRRATKDLPILLNTLSFRNGTYFCKTAIVGGVSEFIDDRGEERSLLFSRWIDLR